MQITGLSGPANPQLAPPGHYMLFVLDADRIPSEAVIVKIGGVT